MIFLCLGLWFVNDIYPDLCEFILFSLGGGVGSFVWRALLVRGNCITSFISIICSAVSSNHLRKGRALIPMKA